ncbi:5'-nucleotidase C-terminal domain-containing protein [Ponticoccus sp. SC2-23]|nr:5'-nucleotidase C-terminal domain-containing protein [Ponticoccus sp. SC6-9]MBM1224947.1 5'-nucleotidase C-terminal domain-containing protein [Ponticoccus sp. SC6-15]MBM1228461.1 5'-nucleotidase C-terminal domain-containing protein [Ponticoccus sp. SC6-38]MBM1233902.1 5'-nucleotidase C-terminal domain-containing protein [Ponticoccus sp. SC6-45]MBM1238962.1 5'-nucleotidase C-terminal domain-containing protein [Ponticoccus sp. SC6-49]MBM1247426.1 5'-nucleotidase C-terminal domain-containing p
MQFAPHDYLSDRPAPGRGLVSVAKLFRRLTRDFLSCPGTAVLLVDNGDAYQGSPVSDAVQLGHDRVHPMIAAMNDMGYDAVTPGNHDFTFGLDFIDDLTRSAHFPFVSSNIVRTSDPSGRQGSPGFVPLALIDKTITAPDGAKRVLKIGIVGFAPPQTVEWESFSVGSDLHGCDIVETARQFVPRLREAGADIVVALAHSGIAAAADPDVKENAVAQLASVGGIDAIVAGHVHRVFPGPRWDDLADADPVAGSICGIPVVMPGAYGSHLGRVDLDLSHDGQGWKVSGFECSAEPVEAADDDLARLDIAPIGQVVARTHEATLRFIRREVGHTPAPIHSYFTLAAPCSALSVTARALERFARQETSLADAGLPLLAAVSPFRAGGHGGVAGYVDIPKGPLLLRHATELYPFPNDLCAIELDGDQLRRWLDHAARIFARIEPGGHDQPLIDPQVPPYQFDVIHGLTYEIDPTRPTERVRNIRLAGGRAITPTDRVIVLTNSFRASGGGGYAEARQARSVTRLEAPIIDILTAYFSLAEFDPTPQEVWRFASIPDTSASFLSGCGSTAHVSDIVGRSIRHAGSTDNGFQRFVLDF